MRLLPAALLITGMLFVGTAFALDAGVYSGHFPKAPEGYTPADIQRNAKTAKGNAALLRKYTAGENQFTVAFDDNALGIQAITMVMDTPGMLDASKEIATIAGRKALVTTERGVVSIQVPIKKRVLVTVSGPRKLTETLKATANALDYAAIEKSATGS